MWPFRLKNLVQRSFRRKFFERPPHSLPNRRSMMTSVMRLAVASLLVAAPGGCQLGQWAANGFKVGPNYETPAAPIAQEWIDYHAPETQPAEKTVDYSNWWGVFND